MLNFNPRSPDGERLDKNNGLPIDSGISIHAPRMGSDVQLAGATANSGYFNPRSPDGERRDSPRADPTRSYFNPRSPDGERLVPVRRVGCRFFHFNPRSPDGERPDVYEQAFRDYEISIHAPRLGSDAKRCATGRWGFYFNPRSPDGERLPLLCPFSCRVYFNPRSPDGERLPVSGSISPNTSISIHAPRMGSDRENGHLRPRYGQNHPFSTLIVSQIVVDVLGTVRKSQKHQRTSHYEVIKQPERQK